MNTETTMHERYLNFVAMHRSDICLELSKSYNKLFSSMHFDFGGHVCIPLFILWVIVLFLFLKPTNMLVINIVSLLFVLFGIWVYRFFRSATTYCSCRFFDEYAYSEILIRYVTRCEKWALAQSASDDIPNVKAFYEYCRRNIISESFNYTT